MLLPNISIKKNSVHERQSYIAHYLLLTASRLSSH